MSEIKQSNLLNSLIEEHLPINGESGKRERLLQKIFDNCSFHTINGPEMHTDIRFTVNETYRMSQEAGTNPIYRVTLQNPTVDFYFIGTEGEIASRIQQFMNDDY